MTAGAVAGPAATASAPATAPAPAPVTLTLPTPTGAHRVGTASLHLADRSRPDPWVPAQRSRHLMIQVWYPAVTPRDYPRAPWMTPATARAYEKANHLPTLNWPTTHAHLGAPVEPRPGGWPVVLYSHGLGGQRSEATALVEDVASHGTIVVTIDHVHDAGAVELPDGHLDTTAVPELTPANEKQVTTKAITARVTDTRFVLDQLTTIDKGGNPTPERRALPAGLRGALDLTRVGMFGHSDGGATTAAVLHADRRIDVGINLDGTLWTADASAGTGRPFVLIGRQQHDRRTDPTWATFWTHQRGPKLQLNLTGSTHNTFHDLAVLLPQAAPTFGMSPEQVTAAVGTINGERAVTVLRTYVNAAFDRYLRNRPERLLDGPSACYPEVRFVP